MRKTISAFFEARWEDKKVMALLLRVTFVYLSP
jgi:hypothetical protein